MCETRTDPWSLLGKNDAERIQTSMVWMAASMRQLAGRMQDLSEATAQLERTVSR